METKILGTVLPVLEVTLEPGESIVAESGELSWMSDSIQLRTTTQAAGGGGLLGVFKRTLGGGSIFIESSVRETPRL